MSGPKISIYALTGEARKNVMEQLRCERQTLVCATQIRKFIAGLGEMGGRLDRSLSILNLLQARDGGQEAAIAENGRLRAALQDALNRARVVFHQNPPVMSPKYYITEEALSRKREMYARYRALRDELSQLEKTLADAETVDDGALSAVQSGIGDALDSVVSFEIEPEDESNGFEERKARAREKLRELCAGPLSAALRARAGTAVSSLFKLSRPEHLSTFETLTLDPLLRDAQAELEKLRELRERYQALCQLAQTEPEPVPELDGGAALSQAVEALELELIRRQEQRYIADCVDEVMAEMGYELLGTRAVRKKSGKQFKNELFRFGEGTAVNVTYSPEGQISMELGGIARQDRLPSAAEAEALTGDMEAFCGEFAEFERRMRARGVIVGDRVALMPPSAEHASIINIADYDIADPGAVSELDIASPHRKRVAGHKAMRRDD